MYWQYQYQYFLVNVLAIPIPIPNLKSIAIAIPILSPILFDKLAEYTLINIKDKTVKITL